VVVVGGGDSALEEAIFLTRYASSVTIVHRRAELRAGAILQNRAKTNPKIQLIYNSIPIRINGEQKVTSITLKNLKEDGEKEVSTDGVFVFIGHVPNTSLFNEQLEMDSKGYILAEMGVKTKIPGVFVAGEAADSVYRQVITSAGMGAAAAIQATHFLENQA